MAPFGFYGTTKGNYQTMALFFIVLIARGCEEVVGDQYTVGDPVGWGLGNDLESWSSQIKFHVGDDLYFSYPSGQHSVLLVNEDDYKSCNIESPVTSDNGMGDMIITLVDAQTYYFICGVPGHCEQGLRLKIEVEHETPSTSIEPPPPDVTAHDPPPPDAIVHEPPPPDVEVHDPPPPDAIVHEPPPPDAIVHEPPPPHAPEELTPPDSPPDLNVDTPTKSPPYYSQYNTFHRNSSPQLLIGTLTYLTTMILSIACTLSVV